VEAGSESDEIAQDLGWYTIVMRKKRTRVITIISSFLLLFIAVIVLIRFYPYTYNFTAYPRITHTKSGTDGDPINMVFVGRKDQIMQSFQKAGWLIPDPITLQTAEKIAVDSLAHRSYPTAPVSNLYVFGRVQDLAFEKPTNDVQKRGHIRLWQTGTLIGGQLVWVGQASYDRGIELSGTNHLPTHHIAPTVDLERNAVGADLEKTGLVKEEEYGEFTHPILYAQNGGGDYYESDGDMLVINYTHAPIQLNQQAWPIYQLKNGVFIFYDTLLTALATIGINL
jgi:LssY C-terminus